MKTVGPSHRFFRPLWLRVLIVAAAAGWGAFELWSGSLVWGLVFLGFAGLSIHSFFIAFDPDAD